LGHTWTAIVSIGAIGGFLSLVEQPKIEGAADPLRHQDPDLNHGWLWHGGRAWPPAGRDEANRSAKLTQLKSKGIGAKRLPAGFVYAFSEMRAILYQPSKPLTLDCLLLKRLAV
jgi:hypothetical protein